MGSYFYFRENYILLYERQRLSVRIRHEIQIVSSIGRALFLLILASSKTIPKDVYMMKTFIKRNGSTILSVTGATGTILTAVLAVKATPKAMQLIEEAEKEKGEKLTKTEVVKYVGPAYIPTILVGFGTIACIFGANVLNKKQQASLTSAYALLDNSYKEYKNKVRELLGEDSDHEIRTEIAKDHYKNEDIEVDDEKELFYDYFSERYFESTMEDVLRAEAGLNKIIAVDTGAYLNEFYDLLDIPRIHAGDELGWSNGILEAMYWTNWVDFDHKKVEMEDGMECCIITMRQEPVIDFAYY